MTRATKQQRKAKRKHLRTLHRSQTKPTRRTLFNDAGSWVSLGHAQSPPELEPVVKAFGPPRFTETDQQQHPDQPMTRLVKDVLPVGQWVTEYDAAGKPVVWNVDQKTLAAIAGNYRAAQQRGYAANLGKEHGDARTGLIHPDELIAPIDAVRVVGNTLWIACYVTPEQATYLANPARKVSIGTLEPFTDGKGNTYPIQLVHVAVTDQPVVTGQGVFTRLAQSAARQEGTNMDNFDAFLSALNSLLESAGGASLPDDTTPENVTERVIGAAAAMGGAVESAPEEPVPEGEGDMPMEEPSLDVTPAGLEAMSKKLSAVIAAANKPLEAKLTALSQEVAGLKSDKANEVKGRFLSRLKALGAKGLAAVRVSHYEKLGAKFGYDDSLLDGAEHEIKTAAPSRVAKTLASATPPEVTADPTGRKSDEDIAKDLEARGIKANWTPTHQRQLANGRK